MITGCRKRLRNALPPSSSCDGNLALMIQLPTDFSDLLKFFRSEQVEYLLVVGGWAVAFHGHPRYTKDMDVWVSPTATNAARVTRALQKFGFSEAAAQSVAFDRRSK